MDATLREITTLIRDVNPETRRKGTYFDFALVLPESRPGAHRMREVGVTCSGSRGADDKLVPETTFYTQFDNIFTFPVKLLLKPNFALGIF